jgi:hypothetical protein
MSNYPAFVRLPAEMTTVLSELIVNLLKSGLTFKVEMVGGDWIVSITGY